MSRKCRLTKSIALAIMVVAVLGLAVLVNAQQMDFATGGHQQAPEFYPGCSSVVNVGHFTLRFNGVQYDYDRQESFWLYVLEWDGVAPQLDYLVIGTGDCIVRANIITACPSGYRIDVDGGSDIYGIKWTAQPGIAELHISFLLNNIYGVGPIPFAIKAGDDLFAGTICGVICEEECELSIICPPDITVDCQDPTEPPGTGEPTVEGTCPPLAVTHSDIVIPGACPQEKTIERTWRVTDSSGLERECVQIINVVDDEAPVLVCPSDTTLGCNEEIVFGVPQVTDNCDPDPTVVPSGPFVVMGPGPCQATHTMCWSATDACGNVSEQCCQSITVTIDREPPALVCASDVVLGCNEQVVFTDPDVTDNCDPDPTVVPSGPFVVMGPGPCQATHTMCWSATDACGNQSEQCCQSITVTIDTEPPALVCASDVVLGCNEQVVFTDPDVTDNCDPDPTVVPSGPFVVMGPGPCQATHTMCWSATDACGNVSEQCCQSITVTIDTEPPALVCASDVVLGCNEQVVFTDPDVTDNCDPDPTVVPSGPFVVMGPGPCQATHTMCWSATDACGNQSEQCCQSITVTLDEEPPVLTCAGNRMILCTEDVVFDEPRVSDNCDPDPVVTVQSTTTTPGPGPGEISHTRCWVAEDACRNVAEPCCQTILQIDEEPPVLTCAPDGELGCNDPVVFTLPEVTDNCDTDPEIVEILYNITPGPGECDETHTKCWVAFDDAGNQSGQCCQSIVRMVDTEPPLLVAAPDGQVACNQDPVFTDPEVTDNCDDAPVLQVASETVTPGAEECEFIYTRCWTAYDDCGNVSEQVCQTITGKQDGVNPILTCRPDKEIPWGSPVIFDDPEVWDNCPGMPPLGEGGEVVSTVLDDGRQTFEKCWLTFDPCGNISNECCQVITMAAEPEPYCTFGCWDWSAACLEEEYNHDLSTFPACTRDQYFDGAFFQGVLIGLEDPPYHSAYWSSAQAVEDFVCGYGIPKVLDRDYVDPVRNELQGVLAGELLALVLNREFSCDGYFSGLGYPAPTSCYGAYVIPGSVPKFAGLTVDEFLVVANRAIGGDTGALSPYGANLMQLWQATTLLNWQFSDCGGRFAQTLNPPALGDGSGEEVPDDADQTASASKPRQAQLNVQPNPLRGSTTIELDLPTSGSVQVDIYDIQGRRIATPLEGHKEPGSYRAVWEGDDTRGIPVASGVYFCRARVNNGPVLMEKMIKY